MTVKYMCSRFYESQGFMSYIIRHSQRCIFNNGSI